MVEVFPLKMHYRECLKENILISDSEPVLTEISLEVKSLLYPIPKCC